MTRFIRRWRQKNVKSKSQQKCNKRDFDAMKIVVNFSRQLCRQRSREKNKWKRFWNVTEKVYWKMTDSGSHTQTMCSHSQAFDDAASSLKQRKTMNDGAVEWRCTWIDRSETGHTKWSFTHFIFSVAQLFGAAIERNYKTNDNFEVKFQKNVENAKKKLFTLKFETGRSLCWHFECVSALIWLFGMSSIYRKMK